MRGLSIRLANTSDIEELIQLRIELQRHLQSCNSRIWRTTDDEARRDELRLELEEMLADADGHLVVVVMNRGIIGFIYGRVLRRTTEIPNIVGSLLGIYIRKQYRRQGVGSRLVEELCAFFTTQSVEEVTSRYVAGNTEAEKFWGSLGFEPVIMTANTTLKKMKEKNLKRMSRVY